MLGARVHNVKNKSKSIPFSKTRVFRNVYVSEVVVSFLRTSLISCEAGALTGSEITRDPVPSYTYLLFSIRGTEIPPSLLLKNSGS